MSPVTRRAGGRFAVVGTLGGDAAPVRHRDPAVRDFVPLVPGQVVDLPVRRHRAGAAAHRAHPHRRRLRRPAPLADALAATRSRSSATSPTSTTRSSPRRPTQGVPWWASPTRTSARSRRAYDVLGCLPPTYEPRATGHIPEMVELMQRLIDAGPRLRRPTGDVYFDVRSLPGVRRAVRPAASTTCSRPTTASARGKRDPRDFALWKGAQARRAGDRVLADAVGPRAGRAGTWSARRWPRKYLGAEFDIHGGGLDLRLPAPRERDRPVARRRRRRSPGTGCTTRWVTLGGEKMSKSLGNVAAGQPRSCSGCRPVELRYYLGAPHYRSLDRVLRRGAATRPPSAYRRIESFVQRAAERRRARRRRRDGAARPFAEAMDDDLGVRRRSPRCTTPSARATPRWPTATTTRLARRWPRCGRCSACSASTRSTRVGRRRTAASDLHAGASTRWSRSRWSSAQAARARKDFAAADAIRDQLKNAGIVVEDTPTGPRWTVERAALMPGNSRTPATGCREEGAPSGPAARTAPG